MAKKIDYNLINGAPEIDSVTLTVFDADGFTIEARIWREENQSVHISVFDTDGNQTNLVLGEESVTTKL